MASGSHSLSVSLHSHLFGRLPEVRVVEGLRRPNTGSSAGAQGVHEGVLLTASQRTEQRSEWLGLTALPGCMRGRKGPGWPAAHSHRTPCPVLSRGRVKAAASLQEHLPLHLIWQVSPGSGLSSHLHPGKGPLGPSSSPVSTTLGTSSGMGFPRGSAGTAGWGQLCSRPSATQQAGSQLCSTAP